MNDTALKAEQLRGFERGCCFRGRQDCRIVVAIPARNEAERIGDCLRALAAQREAGGGAPAESFGVVVFCNGCSDDTFAIAAGLARSLPFAVRLFDGDLAPGFNHAGGARRVALDLAAAWLDPHGAGHLLTTDADSRPPPAWIADTMRAFASGVDAVAGRIDLDAADAAALSPALQARGGLEERYETLLTELFARLDPRPHDPWPRHASEPGASLALTLSAYRRIGGLPVVEFGEDRALVAALDAADLKLRHDPAISVVTSGRMIGRARGGVADALTLRTQNPQAPCDPYLEPALDALRRGFWRGRLRAAHAGGDLAALRDAAPRLGLSPPRAAALSRETAFGAYWRGVEAESQALRRRSLTPRELPPQIAIARAALFALRLRQLAQRAADRSDSPACVASR